MTGREVIMGWYGQACGSIFQAMRSPHKHVVHILSLSVVSTVFLCQVIGSFCSMTTHGTELSTMAAIHYVHAGHHVFSGNRMCQESLPSSSPSQSVDPRIVHELLQLDFSCLIVAPNSLRGDPASNVVPVRSGPLLYIHLSTFRI